MTEYGPAVNKWVNKQPLSIKFYASNLAQNPNGEDRLAHPYLQYANQYAKIINNL